MRDESAEITRSKFLISDVGSTTKWTRQNDTHARRKKSIQSSSAYDDKWNDEGLQRLQANVSHRPISACKRWLTIIFVLFTQKVTSQFSSLVFLIGTLIRFRTPATDSKAIAFRHDETDNGVHRATVASMNLHWLSANAVGRTVNHDSQSAGSG